MVDIGSPSGRHIGLVDGSGITIADDGRVEVDVAERASIQLTDAPTNDSTSGTATTMTSLF